MQLQILLEERDVYRIGLWIVQTIQRRTAQGKDISGKPFLPYSQKPFAMPLGAIPKKYWQIIKRYAKEGEIGYQQTKSKQLWIRIQGGYKFLRLKVFGLPARVDLRRSREMLSELQVIDIRQDADSWQMRIGWTRPDLAERAFYVERKRKFLGLTETDQQTLQQHIQQLLSNRLVVHFPAIK